MWFIIGLLTGIVVILWWGRCVRRYYETKVLINDVEVKPLSFSDSISCVREIVTQISRHKELGCTSYIYTAPFELAHTEVFHQFISEYKYKVTIEETGYKFEILL